MSDSAKSASSGGIGIFGLLGTLFVGLKLTRQIDWEWLWVLAPFWGPCALIAAIVIMILGAAAIATIFDAVFTDKGRFR